MNKLIKYTLLFAVVFSTSQLAVSADELPSGDEIASNINDRDEGVAVSRLLKMEMTDRHGKVPPESHHGQHAGHRCAVADLPER